MFRQGIIREIVRTILCVSWGYRLCDCHRDTSSVKSAGLPESSRFQRMCIDDLQNFKYKLMCNSTSTQNIQITRENSVFGLHFGYLTFCQGG